MAGRSEFVKDWQAAGLKDKIPLYGSGFLTDGTLEAQGTAAQGLETTLHYADGLTNPRDKAFRTDYAKTYKLQPDVYAVQGYDAAQLLAAGANAVKGDMSRKAEKSSRPWKLPRSTARAACSRSRRRTTRCRTSTCARWMAARTRSAAWR